MVFENPEGDMPVANKQLTLVYRKSENGEWEGKRHLGISMSHVWTVAVLERKV
jgi:hypothetical protein